MLLPRLISQQRLTLFSKIMKKFIAAAALFLMSLSFGDRLSAGNFGILGGASFYSANLKEVNAKAVTQWHAGLAYKLNLPLGFHVQPALLYNVKGVDAGQNITSLDLSVGYLELMASVQWGIDLILLRPFVDVSPFVGYGINSWGDLTDLWKNGANKFEYGVGLGGGLDIWRFQIAARYNWNFGRLFKEDLNLDLLKKANFGGVTLSLTYFF